MREERDKRERCAALIRCGGGSLDLRAQRPRTEAALPEFGRNDDGMDAEDVAVRVVRALARAHRGGGDARRVG
jgi:hypothetical protein